MSTASKVTLIASVGITLSGMVYNIIDHNQQKQRYWISERIFLTFLTSSRAAGVQADIARYMEKYEKREEQAREKEEIRRKNKELQDAQIALQAALKERDE